MTRLKYTFFVLVVWAKLFCSVVLSDLTNTATSYYMQKLDHFHEHKDLQNFTFRQKYMVDDSHWGGDGAPIFVRLGGMVDIGTIPNSGILSLSAARFKAVLVQIEHRFYGNSIPLKSIDLAMADHRIRDCLSIKQSLQDFAVIINKFKASSSSYNSPVIVVGSGYAGALATWFKLMYPKIAIGAISSSTPLAYYGSTTPVNGYCSIVSKDFQETDQRCYELIRDSWKQIDDIAASKDGLTHLSHIFNTCRPLNSSAELKKILAQYYSFDAVADDPYRTCIIESCAYMKSERDPINGTIAVIYSGYNFDCLEDDQFIGLYSPFEPTTIITDNWLRCSGLIYPVECIHNTMLPSWPFNMTQFEHSCQEKFGIASHPHTPINFYGNFTMEEKLIESGENIIFSTGLRDPFSSGAILKNLSETIVAVIASEGTYAWDLVTVQDNDPEWLKKKREEELKIIENWIAQYYYTNKGPKIRTPAFSSIYVYILSGLLTFYVHSLV